MPNNYVLLERIELNASAASVTFANIPQSGYTDLKIVVSSRATGSRGEDAMLIRFNSDSTAANYSIKWLRGNGSAATSGDGAGFAGGYIGEFNGGTSTSSTFTSQEVYIPNYTSSNAKSFSVDITQEANQTLAYAHLFAGLWTGTTAVTAITFTDHNSNSFTSGSTFSLYGVAALGTTPTIAPKASGGNIIDYDGTYWIHTFTSSGVFTPQTGLTCDYLVVAGGGGAGYAASGGGSGGAGAGGYIYSTSNSLITTAYTVTVGAGGNAGSTALGTNGSNSIFNANTAIGGGYGSGGSGGSGGGGAYQGSGGTGTSGQGNLGGNGSSTGSPFGAAGGGGAGAASASVGASSGGSAGGIGLSNSITGTAVYYSGGGGGGSRSGGVGAGGLGGGGTGSASSGGGSGTANTGGGGGGAADNGTGGAGGSGVVIIRYLA